MNKGALLPAWHESSQRWCQPYAVSFKCPSQTFLMLHSTAWFNCSSSPIASPPPSSSSNRISRFLCSNAAIHSLVVHSEPGSSLHHPTPLIFIPALCPHLHLSPPPRPPPPSRISLHLSPSLLHFASRSFTCHSVKPRSLHAQRFLIPPLLPPLCLSFLVTVHLYHAASNKFCMEASSRLFPYLFPYSLRYS